MGQILIANAPECHLLIWGKRSIISIYVYLIRRDTIKVNGGNFHWYGNKIQLHCGDTEMSIVEPKDSFRAKLIE